MVDTFERPSDFFFSLEGVNVVEMYNLRMEEECHVIMWQRSHWKGGIINYSRNNKSRLRQNIGGAKLIE